MFTPGYHGNGLQKSAKKVVLLYDFNVKILYRATYANGVYYGYERHIGTCYYCIIYHLHNFTHLHEALRIYSAEFSILSLYFVAFLVCNNSKRFQRRNKVSCEKQIKEKKPFQRETIL